MSDLYTPYMKFLETASKLGTLRELKTIDRCNTDAQKSSRFLQHENKNYINLSSNDYLGLSCHPALSQKSASWAKKYGTGAGASRLITGNLSLFQPIEQKLATLKNTESALIMGAGFQTNATVIQALLNKQVLRDTPLVFSDRLNHASIHFGCAAAQVSQIRYNHCDMKHLQYQLEQYKHSKQPKFIITETIFSMDGDHAPLKEIIQLAHDYHAMVVIDDAHSIGSQNEESRYTLKADVIIGTFSKAFGSYGSYVASSHNIINYLKNKCSGFIYSTALPPPILAAIDSAVDLMPTLKSERNHLTKISQLFRQELQKNQFHIANSSSHIIPLILKDTQKTIAMSTKLYKNNIWATPIRYPTVPKNLARIRFSFSSALKEQDIEKTLSLLI